MFVDPTKAKMLNEGRHIESKFFNYGGFPRIKNLEEDVLSEEKKLSELGKWWDAKNKIVDEIMKVRKDSSMTKEARLKRTNELNDALNALERKKPKPSATIKIRESPTANIDSSREGT